MSSSKVIFFGLIALVIIISAFFLYNNSKNNYENSLEVDHANYTDSSSTFSSSKQEKLNFFPARQQDFIQPPKAYGLWPYGVKGQDKNSHNEGHPGWDLELKKGSKLYAVSDLKINQIHEGDHQLPNQKLMVIEASTQLGQNNIGLVYHSVINIEPNVIEGATVEEGSVLAEVGFPLSQESAMIHFGIFGPKDSIGSCPSDFFSENISHIISFMVSNSFDQETGKPYESACIGKIDREIYFENFPERIQYLQGGEQFE